MKPVILTLCEYASDHNGSLSIMDTFDTISASKFPWRAYFYMAAKISNDDHIGDFNNISINIFPSSDPGDAVFKTSGPFEKGKDFKSLNIVTGFKGMIFNSPGDYILTICFDDTIIAELPFKVALKK